MRQLNEHILTNNNNKQANNHHNQKESTESEALQVGDIYLVEKPHQSILKNELIWLRCFQCFKPLIADRKIPCKMCTQVRYCSFECSNKSWKEGHNLFCLQSNLFKRLKGNEVFTYSPILACLRLIQLDLPSTFIKIRQNQSWKHSSLTDYQFDDDKIDKIAQAAAYLLTFFVKIKPLIVKNNQIDLKYDIELLGAIIMEYLLHFEDEVQPIKVLQFAHQVDDEEVPTLKENVIGHGFYPQISKMKHDCDPNTAISQFEQQKAILRAIIEINKDAEKTLNFKLFSEKASSMEKQSNICRCSTCLLNKKQFLSKAVICSKCKGPVFMEPKENDDDDDEKEYFCSKCNEKNIIHKHDIQLELIDCERNLKQANLCLIRKDLIKAEDYLLDIRRRFDALLHPLNSNFIEVSTRLSYCYKLMKYHRKALIYATRAYECSKQMYKGVNFALFNSLFCLIDRQVMFIIHYGKRKSDENQELYDNVLKLLPEKICEAKFILDRLCLEEEKHLEYFYYLEKKMQEKGFNDIFKQFHS